MVDSNMIRAVILANNSYCPYKNASLLLTDKILFALLFVLVSRLDKDADK